VNLRMQPGEMHETRAVIDRLRPAIGSRFKPSAGGWQGRRSEASPPPPSGESADRQPLRITKRDGSDLNTEFRAIPFTMVYLPQRGVGNRINNQCNDSFAGGCDDRGSAPVPPGFTALGPPAGM